MRKINFVVALAAVGLFLSAAVTSTPAAAVGVGRTCHGLLGLKCNKGLWCDRKPGLCRGADVSGRCIKIPETCNDRYKPVCGCNGKTYSNYCGANAAGISVLHDGKCD